MYTVKETYDRIGISKAQAHILNLAEIWDGGPMEGHLFIQKDGKRYVLCEQIHHYNRMNESTKEYVIQNTDSMESVVREIEAFCGNRYGGTLAFDFRKLLRHEAVSRFFGL